MSFTPLQLCAQRVQKTLAEISSLIAAIEHNPFVPPLLREFVAKTANTAIRALETEAVRIDARMTTDAAATDATATDATAADATAATDAIILLECIANTPGPFTPISLMDAAYSNNVFMVEAHLHADIKLTTEELIPLLTFSARLGRTQIIRLLLSQLPPENLVEPFQVAIFHVQTDTVRIFLEAGADPSSNENEALHTLLSISDDVSKCLSLLVANLPFATIYDKFLHACVNEHARRVKILLPFIPTAHFQHALLEACRHSSLAVIDILRRRVDPTFNNYATLRLAVHTPQVLRILLLDERVDPTFENNWLFKTCCTNLHTSIAVTTILLNDRRVFPDASFFKAVKDVCNANRENGFTRIHEQAMYKLLIPRTKPAVVDKFFNNKNVPDLSPF